MRAGGADVDFESIKGVVIGMMVVVGLIGAGLYALVAFNVRKGKNWARILGTVFAALSIFSLLPLGIGTVAVLLGIAAIVMLYLPASAPYFQKQQPFGEPLLPAGQPLRPLTSARLPDGSQAAPQRSTSVPQPAGVDFGRSAASAASLRSPRPLCFGRQRSLSRN